MFLRSKTRKKDGKEHRYWSVVENRRVADGRVVQRHVLYLGEINAAQRAAWCRSIEVFDEERGAAAQMARFPEDRPAPELACAVVQVKLSGLQLRRPRQWGACWLACGLWDLLQLDAFWQPRLPPSRKGTRWLNVLKTLVAYRLIDPGSAWRLHRHWFDHSALGDRLGEDFAIAHSHTLYRCLDQLVVHKQALFSFLQERWRGLFNARFDILLSDLTSTYFECDPPVREEVTVKLLDHDGELSVLARSAGRQDKERAMRRRRLKRLWKRLHELQRQTLSRDALLLKLGAAKKAAGRAYGLVHSQIPAPDEPGTAATFTFALNRKKLRQARRREGRYLLRCNLTSNDPVQLWTWYIPLTEIEQAFKELKGDLSIRPIYHQLERRIEAHIFVAFLAYCLQVTLKARLRPLAPGLRGCE